MSSKASVMDAKGSSGLTLGPKGPTAERQSTPSRDARWVQGAPPWVISLTLHGLLLVIFALVVVPTVHPRETVLIDSRMTAPIERDFSIDEYDLDFTNSPDLQGPGAAAVSALAGEPTTAPPDLRDEFPELTVKQPVSVELLQSWEIDPVVQIKGSAAEHTVGAEGAIDRLTLEILRSLEQRKTLVAWLFDASGSLARQREAIVRRFDKVYQELEATEKTADQALLSGVVSFGQEFQFLTPEPIDDLEAIKKAVRSVTIDQSGKEHVLTAVIETSRRWLKYRTQARRNFMIIIVTDEAGDDGELLEQALDMTRRYGIAVYVVGGSALFGRETGYLPWMDPNGGRHWIPVRQGPESLMPERVSIPFWGGVGQDLDHISSGFGPFALTRLCRETGGIYFISQSSPGPQFDPLELRAYQPDYVSRAEYQQMLARHRAMAAVVEAAGQKELETVVPQTVFPAPNEEVLRQALQEAQKAAALLEYRLQPMLPLFRAAEPGRRQLSAPRWRAHFDLAAGRVLAMWVRAREYNSVLAQMKQGRRFQNPKSNHWRMRPAADIGGGARLEKLAEEARGYLQRVIDEHPDTPWALLAEKELSQPFGWRWEEFYLPLPDPAQVAAAAATASTNADNPNKPKPKPFTLPKF